MEMVFRVVNYDKKNSELPYDRTLDYWVLFFLKTGGLTEKTPKINQILGIKR
jgi:hypothetical protein